MKLIKFLGLNFIFLSSLIYCETENISAVEKINIYKDKVVTYVRGIHKDYFKGLGTALIALVSAKFSYDGAWYAYDHVDYILNRQQKNNHLKPYFIMFHLASCPAFACISWQALEKTIDYFDSAYTKDKEQENK